MAIPVSKDRKQALVYDRFNRLHRFRDWTRPKPAESPRLMSVSTLDGRERQLE